MSNETAIPLHVHQHGRKSFSGSRVDCPFCHTAPQDAQKFARHLMSYIAQANRNGGISFVRNVEYIAQELTKWRPEQVALRDAGRDYYIEYQRVVSDVVALQAQVAALHEALLIACPNCSEYDKGEWAVCPQHYDLVSSTAPAAAKHDARIRRETLLEAAKKSDCNVVWKVFSDWLRAQAEKEQP